MSPALLKRGQIKMFESIAILLVFIFLVAIALKFYGNMELGRLNEMRNRFAGFDSLKIAVMMTNAPELKCSIQNVQGGACVDKYKVQAMSDSIDDEALQAYYFDLLGFSTVTLEQIKPPAYPENITLYSRVPVGNYSSRLTPVPVSIWDPLARRYALGVLYVQVHAPYEG